MLMKIGDAASHFGISHRALHYWESVGIGVARIFYGE